MAVDPQKQPSSPPDAAIVQVGQTWADADGNEFVITGVFEVFVAPTGGTGDTMIAFAPKNAPTLASWVATLADSGLRSRVSS
jgi:hypothetical protein